MCSPPTSVRPEVDGLKHSCLCCSGSGSERPADILSRQVGPREEGGGNMEMRIILTVVASRDSRAK